MLRSWQLPREGERANPGCASRPQGVGAFTERRTGRYHIVDEQNAKAACGGRCLERPPKAPLAFATSETRLLACETNSPQQVGSHQLLRECSAKQERLVETSHREAEPVHWHGDDRVNLHKPLVEQHSHHLRHRVAKRYKTTEL